MYSAESIIDALKSNNELKCNGIDKIGCPSSHIGCVNDPENCDLCKNQKCSQPVTVHQEYRKLIILNFRYMISLKNHGGFIRKSDSALRRLIDHKFIDEAKLNPA